MCVCVCACEFSIKFECFPHWTTKQRYIHINRTVYVTQNHIRFWSIFFTLKVTKPFDIDYELDESFVFINERLVRSSRIKWTVGAHTHIVDKYKPLGVDTRACVWSKCHGQMNLKKYKTEKTAYYSSREMKKKKCFNKTTFILACSIVIGETFAGFDPKPTGNMLCVCVCACI